ncbi:MAG: hypothetical protein ACYSUM_07660 [Planctomycetota bacterium]|jgi:hypothetical protein
MPRPRFTVGRAFALLILGIAIGVALYVSRHLRPESIKEQFVAELERICANRVDVDDIQLALDTGVEVVGLKIYYPGDEIPAIEAERVALMVDHKELLGGDIHVRQIDVYGLVVRLRYEDADAVVPRLPGVFRAWERGRHAVELPEDFPLLRVLPGEAGSRLEILNPRWVCPEGKGPIRLDCLHAEARPDASHYRLTAKLAGGARIENMTVNLALDPADRTVYVDTEVENLKWERKDVKLLSPWVRERLPSVEVGGAADVTGHAKIQLDTFTPTDLHAQAELRDLVGAFGDIYDDIYDSERDGLPFTLRDGGGLLSFDNGRFVLSDFKATCVSDFGLTGSLGVGMVLDLARAGQHLDLSLEARALEASTEDLRLLLPRSVRDDIVERFLPSGTFHFNVTVSQRPSLPEKVVADLYRIESGKIDYAGPLDELTGKRFGFRYPVDGCSAKIRVETNVATARGFADIIELKRLRGRSRISRRREGDPEYVEVEAEGRIVAYGKSDADGVYREDIDLEIHVRDLPIDAKLAAAFASTPLGVPYKDFDLTGWADTVDIHVQRDGFGKNEPLSSYRVRLKNCALAYKDFPLAIVGVSGELLSRDLPVDEFGVPARVLTFKDLEGRTRSGGTVTCHGEVTQSDEGIKKIDFYLNADMVPVDKKLEDALVESSAGSTGVANVWRRLRPRGHVSASVTIKDPLEAHIVIDLANATFGGYGEIECPITKLTGKITYLDGAVTLHSIGGQLFDAPFHIDGYFKEGGEIDVDAAVDRLHLTEKIAQILAKIAPEGYEAYQRLALHPDSSCDITVSINRDAKGKPIDVLCTIDGLELKSEAAGFAMAVTGGPVKLDPEKLTFEDIWIKAGDAEITIREGDVPHDRGKPAWIIVDGQNIEPRAHLEPLLGSDVREVLGDNLRLDFKGFRLELDENRRTVILSGAIDLRRYQLREPDLTALEPTGNVGLQPVTLKLPDQAGEPLAFHGVIEFKSFNMNMPLDLRDMSGQLLVAEGTLSPEFTVRGAISNGTVDLWERHLHSMSANFSFQPDHLRLGNIDGRLYQGVYRGDVEVHLSDPGAFKVRLRASDVELGELLKEDLPRSDPMTGTLEAAIWFESPSAELQHMTGRGEVRVRDAKLFRIPGLRRILAVLSRATPLDGPRFKRAEADFTIRGERLEVSQVHLSTNLNDIYGRGNVTIYGDLDFVVEPQVTKAIDLPRFFNLPVLSTLRDLWHKTVYEIRLEGTIDSPALRLRALPFLKNTRKQFTQSPHAGRVERMRPRLLPSTASRRPRAVPVREDEEDLVAGGASEK